jgi:prophage maintenance system killer protein
VASALVFLRLNGSPLHAPQTELFRLAMAAARNEMSGTEIAAWIRGRL